MLPLVISADSFVDHLNDPDLLIIDLSSRENYLSGHLPGAIHVSAGNLVSGIKPAVGKLPDKQRLDALFSAIGYSKDKQIVTYDDEGGGWAGRFIWTLDVIGHKKSTYINGGLTTWLAHGLPLSTDQPNITPTTTDIQIDRKYIAEMADVIDSIDDESTVIWDARSEAEYAGTRVVSARSGHVPGAINLDWLDTMDHQNNLQMLGNLQDLLDSKGITKDKQVITHCQSHHRSGLTYLIGKKLGYNIRAYHGSWSEYGNDPDSPIEV
ncbi:MAG: rhodanese-like domain-containing protein [Pseudomonadales bacterium]|jgi:thiosulfate/3-mercaptopyruvate sulfurtransferase